MPESETSNAHRGTKPQPSPHHGGTALKKGATTKVSTPASRQSSQTTPSNWTQAEVAILSLKSRMIWAA